VQRGAYAVPDVRSLLLVVPVAPKTNKGAPLHMRLGGGTQGC